MVYFFPFTFYHTLLKCCRENLEPQIVLPRTQNKFTLHASTLPLCELGIHGINFPHAAIMTWHIKLWKLLWNYVIKGILMLFWYYRHCHNNPHFKTIWPMDTINSLSTEKKKPTNKQTASQLPFSLPNYCFYPCMPNLHRPVETYPNGPNFTLLHKNEVASGIRFPPGVFWCQIINYL